MQLNQDQLKAHLQIHHFYQIRPISPPLQIKYVRTVNSWQELKSKMAWLMPAVKVGDQIIVQATHHQ